MIGAPPQYPASTQSAKVDIQVWRDLAANMDGAVLARVLVGGYVVSDAAAPPIITILGDNPMMVAQGSKYTDPGATATNKYGDDLTSAIFASGSVNTGAPGTYNIKYTVTDTAGISTSTTRVVYVTSQQSPTPPPAAPTPTPSPTPSSDTPPIGQPSTQPPPPGSPPPSTAPTPSGGSGYFEPVTIFNPNGPNDLSGGSSGASGGSNNSDDLLNGGRIGSNGSTLGYAIAVMINTIDTPRAAVSGAVDAGISWSQNQLNQTAHTFKRRKGGAISGKEVTQTPLVAAVLGLVAAIALGVLVPTHFVLAYALVFYPILALILAAVSLKLYKKYMGIEIPPPPSGPRDTFS